jgi:hypothetical protein
VDFVEPILFFENGPNYSARSLDHNCAGLLRLGITEAHKLQVAGLDAELAGNTIAFSLPSSLRPAATHVPTPMHGVGEFTLSNATLRAQRHLLPTSAFDHVHFPPNRFSRVMFILRVGCTLLGTIIPSIVSLAQSPLNQRF